MDAAIKRYKAAEETAAKARVMYKTKKARAFLDHEDGSIAARDAEATVETGVLFEQSEVADAAVRVFKEEIRYWQAHLDAWRTLGATARAEFSTLHYGT